MGFYAIRNIEVGHEVVWDYGVRWEEWSGSRLEKGVVVKGKKEQKEEVVGFDSPSVHEYLSLDFFVKKTATCPILSDDDVRVTGKRKVGHKNDECQILYIECVQSVLLQRVVLSETDDSEIHDEVSI